MEWWRVVAYLLPVAAAMAWIRSRESREGITLFEQLDPCQKAWILLLSLPPGPAGRLVGLLTPQEAAAYAAAGERVRGSGQNLVRGVLREFLGFLPRDWTRGVGRDLDEAVNVVSRHVAVDGDEIAALLLKNWPPVFAPPPPASVPSPLGEGEEADSVEAPLEEAEEAVAAQTDAVAPEEIQAPEEADRQPG